MLNYQASLIYKAQLVNNPPAMQETPVLPLRVLEKYDAPLKISLVKVKVS